MKFFRKSYFEILLFLAKASSSPYFWVIHEPIRLLYGFFAPGFFEMALNGRSKTSRCRVALRGSVRIEKEFNIFLSDLDLTVVVEREDENELRKIRDQLVSLKRFFPPLGESEIYTGDEKKRYDHIFCEIGSLYSFLRKLRKSAWMEKNMDSAPTGYHRFKADRSKKKCFTQLGADETSGLLSFRIEKFLREGFTDLPPKNTVMDVSAWDPYMGLTITSNSGATEKGRKALRLTEDSSLLLLALSPCYFPNDELSKPIDQLRRLSSVNSAFKNLAELELLISTAVRRAHPHVIHPEWIDLLKKSIAEADRLFTGARHS
jgi:hypothetical protein